jgi:putative ABC transport system ATP-binding protein
MTLLRLVDVTKQVSLGRNRELSILRGVNLDVPPGTSTALLGRSGSGKSSLLAILGLLDRPTTGRYEIDGEDTSRIGGTRLARMRGEWFGFVYQRFCLLNHLSAQENVEAPLLHRGLGRRTRRARAREALDLVGLGDRRDHRPGQLSGGEQQRVAIARALVGQPRVLLADEPTGSLDQDTGATVMTTLYDLTKAQGVTLVLVTHDPVIAQRCDRIVHLDRGTVAA